MTNRYAIIGDICAEHQGDTQVAGGSGAIALALRELGGTVTLRSCLGDDDAGTAVLNQLKAARVHPGLIDRLPTPTSTLTRHADGSVANNQPGARMTKGGLMDIYDLFGHDALIVDLHDQSLRTFLIDLPAHTDGTVRMLTTLSHLNETPPQEDELDIAMRCDTIVGTEGQFAKLTGEALANDALGMIFERMPLTHLRAAVAITQDGIQIIARDSRVLKPVRDAVPALLLPQVTAGIAWGMANRMDWESAAITALDPSSAA